jgi:hypothetical protein
MGNVITFTGQFQLGVPSGNNNNTNTIVNNASLTTTGSGVASANQLFNSGSVTALATGSAGNNVRYFVYDNTGTGSIGIYTDLAATKPIAFLQAGDNGATPWSGALSLYAQGLNQSGTTLEYWLTQY